MSSQEDNGPEEAPAPRQSPLASSSKTNALYEPKSTPKAIRVLTVIAYILSVSLAAITLSAYYVFMWDGGPHMGQQRADDDAGGGVKFEPLIAALDDDVHQARDDSSSMENLTAATPTSPPGLIVQHVESFPQQSMNYDGLDNNILSQSEDVSMTTEDEFSWPLETTTAEYNSADFVKTVKRSKFLQKLMFKSSIDDYLMQQDQQQQRSV